MQLNASGERVAQPKQKRSLLTEEEAAHYIAHAPPGMQDHYKRRYEKQVRATRKSASTAKPTLLLSAMRRKKGRVLRRLKLLPGMLDLMQFANGLISSGPGLIRLALLTFASFFGSVKASCVNVI